jgi:hypothetical protein
MKLLKRLSFYLLSLICFLSSCTPKDTIELNRVSINNSDDVDTLEVDPATNVTLLGVTKHRALGKFTYDFIFSKHGQSGAFNYQIKSEGLWPKVTDRYIALAKAYPDNQWGWFLRRNNNTEDVLPNMAKIKDSIKQLYPKHYFVQNSNGYLLVYENGKLKNKINYGNAVTRMKDADFDKLDYKLYKAYGDSIVAISNNPDDILKHENGLFFVPPPGFGVIKKADKSALYKIIDSLAGLTSPPEAFHIGTNMN